MSQFPQVNLLIKEPNKIIRSQYKLISDKSSKNQNLKTKVEASQSERKDQTSRSVLSSLASGNVSTNDLNMSHISEGGIKETSNYLIHFNSH